MGGLEFHPGSGAESPPLASVSVGAPHVGDVFIGDGSRSGDTAFVAEHERAREEIFCKLVETAPFGVCVVDSALRILASNKSFEAWIRDPTIRSSRDFAEILRATSAASFATAVIDRCRRTLESGEGDVIARPTDELRKGDASQRCDWEIQRVTLPDGTFGVAFYFRDLATLRRAEAAAIEREERQLYLLALDERLRRLRDPVEIQDEAVRLLAERLGVDWVHYAEFDADLSYATVQRNYAGAGAPTRVGRHPMSGFKPMIAALHAGLTVAEADLQLSPLTSAEGRAQCAAVGLRAYVAAPIVLGGRLLGAVSVADRAQRDWTQQEIALVEGTAERTWDAVERARAEQSTANELRNTQLLHEISARLVSEADTQTFLDAIVAAAIAITGANAGAMRLLDPKTDVSILRATQGFDPEMTRYLSSHGADPNTSVGVALTTGRRAFVEFDDPSKPDPDGVLRRFFDAGFRCAQYTPLISRTGRTIGVLSTFWRECRRPSEAEFRFLDLLARQAADLSERRRTDDELRESQKQLSAELADSKLLQTLSAHLTEEEDSTALYEKIVAAASSIMRSEFATLQILHRERGPSGELRLLTYHGFTAEAVRVWEWIGPTADTPCAQAMRTGARVLAPDIERADFMVGTADQARLLGAGVRAGQTTPLVSRGGQTVGMISTYWREPHEPSERDLRLLDLVARQAADLMERTQAAETLRRNERQLKEADRRKDEFLAVLAHELRNPLAPIRTGLELIRLAGDAPDVVANARTMMERQVGHMVRLIDDLLDVSRITSGKIQLQRQPTALAALVNTAIEASREALVAGRIALEVDSPEATVLVDVDPTRFVQILSNVLHNAVKFTAAGGHVRVSALVHEAAERKAEARVVVADSGVGISAELLPRVFDLFAQDDASAHGARPGLGIGLALARQLIEMHGGTIEAHSDGPGLGSAFTIRLPLSTGVAATEATTVPRDAPRIRRRVVVIDDNVDAANAMKRLVTVLGGECRAAYNGEAGLAEVLAFRPDIVFLDIGMPGIDGYEVCRRIRRQIGSDLVVVALTGWGQERNKQEAARAGFDLHLTKPADPLALETILETGRAGQIS